LTKLAEFSSKFSSRKQKLIRKSHRRLRQWQKTLVRMLLANDEASNGLDVYIWLYVIKPVSCSND